MTRRVTRRGEPRADLGDGGSKGSQSLLRRHIPACIVVLDKENANARKGVFMIDASKGFIKDGNKNRLREQDIHLIVDTFNPHLAPRSPTNAPKLSRSMSLASLPN